jgi:hypothetical protein
MWNPAGDWMRALQELRPGDMEVWVESFRKEGVSWGPFEFPEWIGQPNSAGQQRPPSKDRDDPDPPEDKTPPIESELTCEEILVAIPGPVKSNLEQRKACDQTDPEPVDIQVAKSTRFVGCLKVTPPPQVPPQVQERWMKSRSLLNRIIISRDFLTSSFRTLQATTGSNGCWSSIGERITDMILRLIGFCSMNDAG